MVASGRITMRTPPVNGKIGKIRYFQYYMKRIYGQTVCYSDIFMWYYIVDMLFYVYYVWQCQCRIIIATNANLNFDNTTWLADRTGIHEKIKTTILIKKFIDVYQL